MIFVAEAIFMTSVAGMSILFGFGTTVAAAKKKDPEYFNKGMSPAAVKMEAGASLAMRALGWGTVYAVGGCGIFFYAVWKMLGVKDVRNCCVLLVRLGGIMFLNVAFV